MNEELLVNSIRILSIDMVEKAKSGHPGMPLGASPIIYTIFRYFLRFDPKDTKWDFRDIFILSAGHSSAMLYATLHLFGYDLAIDDLKSFRQLHSKTPGHPEYGLTPGVETTTGPLGQGAATSVGFAFSRKYLSEVFDKDIKIFGDSKIFVIASDGDLMEGVSYEAASLAGHMKINNLIWIYDSNKITIEGSTDLSFSDDIKKRFESCGWDFFEVSDANNIEELKETISNAIRNQQKPVLIKVNSRIGYKSPKENSNKVHGEPLNEDEVNKTRENLNWQWKERFYIPDEIKKEFSKIIEEKINQRKDFDKKIENYKNKYSKDYEKLLNFKKDIEIDLKDIQTKEPSLATRESFGVILNNIAQKIENIISGSADLAPSTKSELKNYPKRTIHFGVREHAMGAFSNGVVLDGFLRPFCSTFLVFSDYMRPSIRLAALMDIPTIFVFTHDSIGVGEDGPTHQPIEHLMSLRLIPNILVIRPADFFETKKAIETALKIKKPTALILTRQKVSNLFIYKDIIEENFQKGIYLLENNNSKNLIIASGSEVSLAIDVYKKLEANNIKIDLASAPSTELFLMQNKSYKESFLKYEKIFVIEAANSTGWSDILNRKTINFHIENFGHSAKHEDVYKFFSLIPEYITSKILNSI